MPCPAIPGVRNGDFTFDPINFPGLPRVTLSNASKPPNIWSEINGLGTQPFWTALIGYGQSTNGKIVQAFAPQYYSKPCYQIELDDGDGTVPLYSAQASVIPATRIYTNEIHAKL